MTQPVFEIPITYIGGCAPGFRARISERLGPVPGPGKASDKPWALHRRFRRREGRIDGSNAPQLCSGALGKGKLIRRDMMQISAADQDLYGGVAWAVLSELDHYGECRQAIMDRNWFDDWSTYILPHGTLICPENPAKALEDLMVGFGASAMDDKIARGVFCVLADRNISNHARLELSAGVNHLIDGLLGFFGRPDIPGDPAYRLRTAA